jgi:Uncharacterized conserved domain (SAYSvFN)
MNHARTRTLGFTMRGTVVGYSVFQDSQRVHSHRSHSLNNNNYNNNRVQVIESQRIKITEKIKQSIPSQSRIMPGFQRSRALWENCRRSHSSTHLPVDPLQQQQQQQQQQVLGYIRAIMYEVQPIRYSVLMSTLDDSYRCFTVGCWNFFVWGRRVLPRTFHQVGQTVTSLTWNQWKWTMAIALYYVFLRWIHATLDAGPVVLILTALTTIFTVGLSDQANLDGLSAYSVFNKGFQKILGSIDADDLLQQHLGGGGMMQMMIHRRPIDDDFEWDNDEDAAPRRPRRPHHNQRANNNNNNNNNDNDNDNIANVHEQGEPAENNIINNPNRARRTGKKARRDRAAIEQRREIRAQRDAALAMGLGHIHDDDRVAAIANGNDDDDNAGWNEAN